MHKHLYFVYLMTNRSHTVLYIGVTNDLARCVNEHRTGIIAGFTKRYRCHKLVYAESYDYIDLALAREKQLKGWLRAKKNALVESSNPEWHDLGAEWNLIPIGCHPERSEGSQRPPLDPSLRSG